MRESEIEAAFKQAVNKRGGMAVKFISPGCDGMPDRLVLFPGGRIAFVELKAPGEKPRPLQLVRHKALRNLGFEVHILDDKDEIEELIDEIQST